MLSLAGKSPHVRAKYRRDATARQAPRREDREVALQIVLQHLALEQKRHVPVARLQMLDRPREVSHTEIIALEQMAADMIEATGATEPDEADTEIVTAPPTGR